MPDIGQILIFFIIFARIISFIGVSVFFSHPAIPTPTKIGIGVFLSLLMFPLLSQTVSITQYDLLPLTILVIKEVLVGLIIGFSTTFLFSGIQFAGDLIGIDMGFALATAFDPEHGANVPVLGSMKYTIVFLVFLIIDGHHFLIQALHYSYSAIPVGGLLITDQAFRKIVYLIVQLYIVAMKISAPVLIALFLTNIALGILSRAVPHMNVFLLSFPLKIGVGFYVLIASMPFFVYVFQKLLVGFESDLVDLIKALSNG